MARKITMAGFAFAAVLSLNAGPNGIDLSTAASAQSLNQCVAQTERILGNPVNYLGAKYARAVDAKIKAMKVDRKRVASEACKTARGDTKAAVALAKNDVGAMLMGLLNPAQAGVKPSPPGKVTPQEQVKKNAEQERVKMEQQRAKHLAAQRTMLLKKQHATFQAQCAAVKMESSKLAMQAKAIQDAKMMAEYKKRMAQASVLNAKCTSIGQAMEAQTQALNTSKKPDPKALATMDQAVKDSTVLREELRKKRQMSSTAFQEYDQKTNQLYNMLSQITKTMHETRKNIIQNMR
ncbi:MAG: hypothetical protein WD407_04235 [Rhodospirillales bacterium]